MPQFNISTSPALSLIIPVGGGDKDYLQFITNLIELKEFWPQPFEILFSGDVDEESLLTLRERLPFAEIQIVKKYDGRAKQQNRAAELARGEYLWFLHCDSLLSRRNILQMSRMIRQREKKPTLYYFNLIFYDGPARLWINELGLFLRSHLFQLPFGDQGFLVKKELFFLLGGFDAETWCGEDYEFVWMCKKERVRIKALSSVLKTSGRRYSEEGWGWVTRKFAKITWKKFFYEMEQKRLRVPLKDRVRGFRKDINS